MIPPGPGALGEKKKLCSDVAEAELVAAHREEHSLCLVMGTIVREMRFQFFVERIRE